MALYINYNISRSIFNNFGTIGRTMSILKKLHYFAENTNLHGFKYIAASTHFIIGITWTVVLILSSIGMFLVFKGTYEAYTNNAISFVTETTYLEWNTTFPAISVCEISSSEVFWTPAPNESYSEVQQFAADVIFFTGSCNSCNIDCEECDRLNFKILVKQYRKKCTRLLNRCRWNDHSFDCCESFLPIETEYGICFSINSMHTMPTATSEINMKSNRKSGAGELVIETLDDIRLYMHAPEDVPFINSDPDHRRDILLGEIYNISLSIIEIQNDDHVMSVNVDKRGCRFPWELPENMRVHKYYSYSTCVVQCHAEAHLRLCNCTHHLMPILGKKRYCDKIGLQCLTEYFETVNRLHAAGFDKPGLVCECVPSCIEPEYKIVSEQKGLRVNRNDISIKMHSLPTFRFKRNVVRTTLDLVVSIGGTAGLFFGASLLSIIEIAYLLFIRR